MAERPTQLLVRATTAAAYIEPEILALPQTTLDRFLREVPGLELYRHQLDDLNRKRPHVRSAEIEAVLAAAGEIAVAPGTIFTMIENADLSLPMIKNEASEEEHLTHGNYLDFIRHADRPLHIQVFEYLP